MNVMYVKSGVEYRNFSLRFEINENNSTVTMYNSEIWGGLDDEWRYSSDFDIYTPRTVDSTVKLTDILSSPTSYGYTYYPD